MFVAEVWMCLLSACLAAGRPAEEKLERFEYQQIQMGVPFRIALYAPDEAVANTAAKAAFARIKKLNAVLSDYDPDSELMQLCRSSGPDKRVTVSRELFQVLSAAQSLSKRTDGAFDVTVGPYVRLWRKARRKKELPAASALAAAKKLVGFRHVHLDPKQRTVELRRLGMRLDLGGIAKGYAGDEALAVLKTHGITRALIDGSGDIVVGDAPPGKTGWRIGIAPLSKESDAPNRHVLLKNAAVATSGDAFQFVEIDGTRYSHIIDPKTGVGLTSRSSVTVIARDGITADSLASAVSVMGVENGIRLIDHTKETAALVVVSTGGRTRASTSQQFGRYLEPAP